MIDALVSHVVDRLGDFVCGEVQDSREIDKDTKWLKGELSMMQAFLRDANTTSTSNEAVKEWVKHVRNVAFKIEDFLDTYMYNEKSLMIDGDSSATPLPMWFKEFMHNNLLGKWNATSHIQRIKEMVEYLAKRAEAYGLHHHLHLPEAEAGSSRYAQLNLVQSPFFVVEEEEMVGFHEGVRKIMKWLLSEEETRQHSVMAIVGMGGSGKTTLAKTIYKLAKNHCNCHLWISASQYSQVSDLIADLLEGFCGGSEKRVSSREKRKRKIYLDRDHFYRTLDKRRNLSASGGNLTNICTPHTPQLVGASCTERNLQLLYSYLRGKRYVLVLDDLNGIHFWNAIKQALPCNGGGRIIITSRETITASLVNDNCLVHTLDPLPEELAWDLFRRTAFQNYPSPGNCPDYLKELGAAIVRRCCGLPLAIVLMGGLMSNKPHSPREWKYVLDHFNQELHYNPCLESLNQVFKVSFDNLHSHLKYCFLYSCLFPKGFEIKRKKIIQMWVAQGFVREQQGKTLEEVANDYFIQLIERNMLQPIASDLTGELIACRVHGIVHDCAVGKFEGVFGIVDKHQPSQMLESRYLAMHNDAIIIVPDNEALAARSLLVFSIDLFHSFSLQQMLLSLRHLKVLCLDNIPIDNLPSDVGNLLLLRYLSLRGTLIEFLPNSLGTLYNLETLDVRNTRIKILPNEIIYLKKLRHLLLRNMKMYSYYIVVGVPVGLDNLHLLQTLSGVKVNMNLIRELGCLTQLRKLNIRITGQEQMHQLLASIGSMENLCSLKVVCRDGKGIFKVMVLSSPFPEYLEKLALGGIMMELPPWFSLLKSLRVLNLVNTMLILDPLSNLDKLPNLVSLSLFHAYTGEKMGCGSGGFPKLRHLHIADLVEFEEWSRIEEGTMPCLQFLCIVNCGKLRKLPEGFEQLKSLQTLEVIEMSDEFIERLKTQDNSKVQHILKTEFLPKTGPGFPGNSGASSSGPST